MRPLWAQARTELLLSLRQGEQLLVALGIPLLILVFFSLVDIVPTTTVEPIDTLAPAVFALAVMSTAMVSQGIATGFERHYGVLKRLAVTPLGRPRLLAAKTAVVVLTELAQGVVLTVAALALGWRPDPSPLLVVAAFALGTMAFSGIGLTLAGTLSGPANLAACNGLYLVLLLFGGVVVPPAELPGVLRPAARLLPSGALVDAFGSAAGGLDQASAQTWIVLAIWGAATPLVAATTFRWRGDAR